MCAGARAGAYHLEWLVAGMCSTNHRTLHRRKTVTMTDKSINDPDPSWYMLPFIGLAWLGERVVWLILAALIAVAKVFELAVKYWQATLVLIAIVVFLVLT